MEAGDAPPDGLDDLTRFQETVAVDTADLLTDDDLPRSAHLLNRVALLVSHVIEAGELNGGDVGIVSRRQLEGDSNSEFEVGVVRDLGGESGVILAEKDLEVLG